MANTENIEAKLCAYIDGDLDAAGRLEIEKHLAANPQHRGLIEQLSKQRDLLRELPRESAPEEILEALQSQMERSVLLGDADAAAEADTLKIQRWPQLMAMAAIVLLTVGLGLVIYMVLPGKGGDANYGISTTRGAMLEESAATTAPDTTVGRDSTATDVAGSAAAPERAAAEVTEKAEPADALAASPAVPETLAKGKAADDADVFAPVETARAGGAGVWALNDLLDAQNRLQNADIARQLKETPGGLNDNAMFVVVNTADPSAARSEVTSYLESNKIAWDSVAHPMPDPLDLVSGQRVNLSRAQSLNVQMKSRQPESDEQQPEQPQPGRSEPEQQRLAQQQPGQPQADQPQLGQQQQALPEAKQEAAKSGVADAAADVAGQQPADPIHRREERSDVVDATQQLGEPFEPSPNSAATDPERLGATTTTQQQKQLAQQPFQVRQSQLTDGESRLIIARGMTKQQAAELSSNLSKQTTVQRAAVYEPRSLPAAAAAAVPERNRDRAASTTGPTTGPVSVAQELGAAPTTAPATEQFGLDAVPATQGAVQPTATTAPAAPSPSPLATGEAEIRALGVATTQPADERVDVVILVQDDVPPDAILEQVEDPTVQQQEAAPAPATNPAAATAPSAPTTQPVPELTF